MNLEIGETITLSQHQECEHIPTFGVYEIYLLNEDISFLFTIDKANQICSCFEFVERYYGYEWIQKRFDDKTLTEPPFIRPK